MPKTTILIPNYNGAAFITPCLRSVVPQCSEDVSVLVVDNGSTDGSDKTAESFPGVQVLRLGENTGFTGAVNAGLEASSDTDYILLLNNDTVVGKRFVGELISAMERHPDAFSAQARMRRMDRPELLDGAGDIYCAFGWALERGKDKPAKTFSKEETVFSACAGAAIYRTEVMKKLKGLDPAFFAYLEDVDLGWRAKRAGWKNYYIPSANVLHAGSGTSGSRHNKFKVEYSSRNNIYLLRKNMPLRYRIALLPALMAGFAAKIVYFSLKGFGKIYVTGLWKGFQMKLPPEEGTEVKKNADREIVKEILRAFIP